MENNKPQSTQEALEQLKTSWNALPPVQLLDRLVTKILNVLTRFLNKL